MDLRQWLLDELDDMTARLKAQVLFVVPEDRRSERPGGGNSINWACFHVARHADLALSALTGRPEILPPVEPPEGRRGGGLEEDEQQWSVDLEAAAVDDYLAEVLVAARQYISAVDSEDLDRVPDASETLTRAGVPADTFDWLYWMWSGKPVSFFIRWSLIGHAGNHVGEMIATRNRMGLSPF